MTIVRGRKDVSEVERDLINFQNEVDSKGYIASQTEATHIYLSDANGDDNNDGLTAETAVATFARAYSLVPYALSAPCVVHVGSGTYAGASLTNRLLATPNSHLWVYGDGAGQPGDDGFTVLKATEAAVSGGTTTLVTSGGMTPDEYAGKTLEIVSGSGEGIRMTIGTNTATDIVPLHKFDTIPDGTTQYRVVESAVLIDTDNFGPDGGDHGTWFSRIGNVSDRFTDGPWLGVVNIRFTGNSFSSIDRCGLVLQGCQIDSGIDLQITQTNIICGNTNAMRGGNGGVSNFWEALGFSETRAKFWDGWGITLPSASFGSFRAINSQIDGNFYADGDLYIQDGTNADLRSSYLQRLIVNSQAYVRLNGTDGPGVVVNSSNATGTVVVETGAILESSGLGHVFNNSGAGPCLHVRNGGVFVAEAAAPTGSNSGSGPGVLASGGQYFHNRPDTPLITGSNAGVNDLELDNGTQAANSSLSAAGTGISNLGSIIQRTR